MSKELTRLREAVRYLTGDVITGGYLPHHVLCAVQDKVDAILNPPPVFEEVSEVVGWVNVYPDKYPATERVKFHVTEQDANDNAISDRISCQPITVTVRKEVKAPVERSVTICDVIWKQLVGTTIYFPSHGTRAVDWSQFLDKKGSLTFTYPE